MPHFLRILIAFVLTIILAVILTPLCGSWYENFFGNVSVGFFGPSHPEYIPGFVIAYLFSFPLFFLSLLEQKRIFWLLVGILPMIALILWGRDGELLIMGAILLILGASLGLLAARLARIGEKN
ncbi:MAG: hypothetical protein Athens101410_213 [Parcubacteria group bacterium Athens1014_10]|nr:MAG: hypothetical protein Athens101410_213 [Parcubacteria group bacterium Athens1014_10]TSD04771.1 MAG: hypothetical protein Athens071412_646 [Parcubacteria group bacterium Athens0714_12]